MDRDLRRSPPSNMIPPRKPASELFTRDDVFRMTPCEVEDYWVRRNRWFRDNGLPHVKTLLDVRRDGTEMVVATIDGGD